jgi:hypothetical protein
MHLAVKLNVLEMDTLDGHLELNLRKWTSPLGRSNIAKHSPTDGHGIVLINSDGCWIDEAESRKHFTPQGDEGGVDEQKQTAIQRIRDKKESGLI